MMIRSRRIRECYPPPRRRPRHFLRLSGAALLFLCAVLTLSHSLSWKTTAISRGGLASAVKSHWLGDTMTEIDSQCYCRALGYQEATSASFASTSISLLQPPTTTVSSRRFTRRSTFLVMGKGDGKKKRKKKSSPSSPSSSSAASTNSHTQQHQQQQRLPAPQRVSTDINIPVRIQIKYGQMKKEARKQSSTSFRQKKVQRTKYRKTLDEEEIQLKAQERAKRGQDPDWDVILNQTATAPLVIVDGYNIIHKWPRLKKHMTKGDAQRARQLLVDDLENLRSLKGWRIEVVFDGTGRSVIGPLGSSTRVAQRITASDQAEKKQVTKYGVRTVFTGVGIEADSYIEKRCAEARNVTQGELTSSFIVATDDAMIRMAGQSAGAYCMGADRFVDELKSVKKAMDYRVEAAVAKVNGHAIRPAKLRGYVHGFGRNQILIEDKRKKNRRGDKAVQEQVENDNDNDELDIEIEMEDGIPWWAKVPDQRRFNDS